MTGDSLACCPRLGQTVDSSSRLPIGSEYSLSASLFSTSDPLRSGQTGNVVLMHAWKCSWKRKTASGTSLATSFLHRLGFQYVFDGPIRVSTDENILRIHVERALVGFLGTTLDSDISTPLLNSYSLIPQDSGNVLRILKSAFLTPMVWNFSLGVNLLINPAATLNLGLTGMKLTLVRNREVYRGLPIQVFNGVPGNQRARLEYGLTLRFMMDRTFRRIFRWNTDLLLFKNLSLPWDVDLKNSLEFRVTRFFMVSLLTKLVYDQDISRRLQWENLVSAGFSARF
jgi:hypothetical protein